MTITAATLAQAFAHQAQKYGARALLKDKVDGVWRDHSWNDVAARAMRLRAGLARLGVKSGDRVAILSENSPEWVIVDQAVLGLGAIVVPLYTTSGAEETRHVIVDCGARLVAVNGDHLIGKLRGLGALTGVEAIIAMHSAAAAHDGDGPPVITMAQLSDFAPRPALEGRRDDLATFIYTSGTTGASKGVMLSHGNLLANCESNLDALGLNETDTVLSFLPVAHSFERTAGYYTVVAAGGTIAYAEGLAQIAQNLLEIEPTVVLTVPRLLEVVHSRVMRTIESAPAGRQKIFRAAVRVGGRAAGRRQEGRALRPWT
ncbi:MAG: AMP-binding protein, partial [Candidatus Binataceae bacterium]